MLNVGCVKIKYKITRGLRKTLYSSIFEPNILLKAILYVYPIGHGRRNFLLSYPVDQ